jgi:hypothetical protein
VAKALRSLRGGASVAVEKEANKSELFWVTAFRDRCERKRVSVTL